MVVNNLYVELGSTNQIFSNYGEFTLRNASTSLFTLLAATDGGAYRADIDTSSFYDHYDLYPGMIGFNAGDVIVDSSALCGFSIFGFITTDGTMKLNNTLFSYVGIVVGADDDVNVKWRKS